ncbi:IS3 family transposase, partial [Rhodocyclus tenuis]|nr:IS3 family transposase [Rhodocyclus gracilis]
MQPTVRRLCYVMEVHPSGYYAWKAQPPSPRRQEDPRLQGLIKQSWMESGGVYGYRKIAPDLRDLGERSGKHRVYRLMRQEGLRAQVGYRRRSG